MNYTYLIQLFFLFVYINNIIRIRFAQQIMPLNDPLASLYIRFGTLTAAIAIAVTTACKFFYFTGTKLIFELSDALLELIVEPESHLKQERMNLLPTNLQKIQQSQVFT